MTWTLVSVVLAFLSLVISLIVALRSWQYSEIGVRYTARNQYMNALFDIDRQLLSNPHLWAVYDNHPLASTKSSDPIEAARREAFIYLHLNLFETVFNDYRSLRVPDKNDLAFWASWDSWIRLFFAGSQDARELFASARVQEIFHSDFVEYVNQVIGLAAPQQ